MKIVDEKSKLLGIIDTGLKFRFELLYSASACELCELCELHGLIYANSFKIWMSSFLRNNFVSKNISNLMWIIQTTQNVWTYVFRSENIWLQNATIQLYLPHSESQQIKWFKNRVHSLSLNPFCHSFGPEHEFVNHHKKNCWFVISSSLRAAAVRLWQTIAYACYFRC